MASRQITSILSVTEDHLTARALQCHTKRFFLQLYNAWRSNRFTHLDEEVLSTLRDNFNSARPLLTEEYEKAAGTLHQSSPQWFRVWLDEVYPRKRTQPKQQLGRSFSSKKRLVDNSESSEIAESVQDAAGIETADEIIDFDQSEDTYETSAGKQNTLPISNSSLDFSLLVDDMDYATPDNVQYLENRATLEGVTDLTDRDRYVQEGLEKIKRDAEELQTQRAAQLEEQAAVAREAARKQAIADLDAAHRAKLAASIHITTGATSGPPSTQSAPLVSHANTSAQSSCPLPNEAVQLQRIFDQINMLTQAQAKSAEAQAKTDRLLASLVSGPVSASRFPPSVEMSDDSPLPPRMASMLDYLASEYTASKLPARDVHEIKFLLCLSTMYKNKVMDDTAATAYEKRIRLFFNVVSLGSWKAALDKEKIYSRTDRDLSPPQQNIFIATNNRYQSRNNGHSSSSSSNGTRGYSRRRSKSRSKSRTSSRK